MRVHHLNCGDLRPLGLARAVCHVLVLERDDGLVLVDSGFGLADLDRPSRLGRHRSVLGVRLDPELTAVRQLERLGLDPGQVRDIVVTHLDLDHAGGLVDFPDALVHTTAAEYGAATDPSDAERSRYPAVVFAHGPRVRTYAGPPEPWRYGVRGHPVEGVPGVTLLPLVGHTRGHAAVAVELPDGGVLVHAGDAAFDASVFGARDADGRVLRSRPMFRLVERAMAVDRGALPANHAVLAALAARPEVRVVTAHDGRQLG